MPDTGKGDALAVKTLLMGWSWAATLAQMNPKDILKPALDEEGLMIQSTQALIFEAPAETSALWLYVDDFRVLILTDLPGSARSIRDRMKAELKKNGLDVHEEEEGAEIRITGILVGGSHGAEKAKGLTERMSDVHFAVAMIRDGIKITLQALQS